MENGQANQGGQKKLFEESEKKLKYNDTIAPDQKVAFILRKCLGEGEGMENLREAEYRRI